MATRLIKPMTVDKEVDDWLERIERAIEWSIVQEKKTDTDEKDSYAVSQLLSIIGPLGYKVLKSYCAPQKLSKIKYTNLT